MRNRAKGSRVGSGDSPPPQSVAPDVPVIRDNAKQARLRAELRAAAFKFRQDPHSIRAENDLIDASTDFEDSDAEPRSALEILAWRANVPDDADDDDEQDRRWSAFFHEAESPLGYKVMAEDGRTLQDGFDSVQAAAHAVQEGRVRGTGPGTFVFGPTIRNEYEDENGYAVVWSNGVYL